VPVPTTRRRRLERGFDQTKLLASELQRRCGLQIADLLKRGRGPAQHGRSRRERLSEGGWFGISREPSASCAGLVLFDDVCTTGATLVDAAATLEEAGLNVEGALTIAWAPQERR